MNVADYPKMKTDGRKKFYKSMDRMAHPERVAKQITAKDLKRKMNRGGFGN